MINTRKGVIFSYKPRRFMSVERFCPKQKDASLTKEMVTSSVSLLFINFNKSQFHFTLEVIDGNAETDLLSLIM